MGAPVAAGVMPKTPWVPRSQPTHSFLPLRSRGPSQILLTTSPRRRQAQRRVGGGARLAAHRGLGVVVAAARLLDHAVDDAVDGVAGLERALGHVLELGGVEAALAELLVGDVVAPAGREAPAVPVDRRRDRHDAVELVAEALRHLVAFAAAVGAADEVVPVVPAAVVGLGDVTAPQVGVVLTAPCVVHDAAVVDGAVGVEPERRAAFARRRLDRGRWRFGLGIGFVMAALWPVSVPVPT